MELGLSSAAGPAVHALIYPWIILGDTAWAASVDVEGDWPGTLQHLQVEMRRRMQQWGL